MQFVGRIDARAQTKGMGSITAVTATGFGCGGIPIGFGFLAAVKGICVIGTAVIKPAVAGVHVLFGIAVHEEEIVILAESKDAAGQVVLESELAVACIVTVEAVCGSQAVCTDAVTRAAQRVIFF